MQIPSIRIGDRVVVRRQKWRVTDVLQGDACQLLALSGTGPSNLDASSRVITPFDLVDSQQTRQRLRIVTMPRWRLACRGLLARRGTADRLRTAATARIDLLPHQLEPALAVTAGLGSRLLIADDVGLGKTIEAGLVISELRVRGAADRVLILAPAGLREQWATELRERFGIEALVVDMREARRQTEQLPIGLNPWSTVPIAISSIDYVKRPEVLPVVSSCRWDAVVVDEAHNITAGSDRHAAVAALCGFASYVLLLTATPHSGDRAAFGSLCDLGARDHDRLLMFRRSRRDVVLGPPRRVRQLRVKLSEAERRMHAALGRLTSAVCAERREISGDVWLMLTLLHKRACSSARSLERSIARKLEVSREPDETLRQPPLPLAEDADEQTDEDEEPPWSIALLENEGRERDLLRAIALLASAACLHETKLAALDKLVSRLERRGEAVIIFTEYRDTLLHVRDVLGRDAAVMHGGLGRGERRAALEQFTGGRQRLLLTTDAASEGLNLHQTCRTVINLELPWNPVRLEQRIGRVDRIGQRRRVHVFHLVAEDTHEIDVLARLEGRIATARLDVGAADPLASSGGDRDDLPVDLPFVRLENAAAAEHRRLREARALLRADRADLWSQGTREGPMAAIARRRSLRLHLGPRVIALMETTIEDSVGRVVASHLTPVAFPASQIPSVPLRGRLHELVLALERLSLGHVDPALQQWMEDSLRMHEAFWTMRIARSQAIAQACDSRARAPLQAGLFDRRAELAQSADDQGRAMRRDELARSIAAAEAARGCHVGEARVVLLMVPGSWKRWQR